jgi:GH15 family glucan-1,4-alpha-glucosidase
MFNEEEKRGLRNIHDKSLEVIDTVTLDNGALLASPPGTRFPYVYPRDTALILRVLNELGESEKVKKTLEFLAGAQREAGEWTQRYDKEGNAASYKPPQLDGVGLILHAFGLYYEKSGDKGFLEQVWRNIHLGMSYIAFHYIPELKIIFSVNGLHEWPPMEAGFDIWGNVCCYAGIKASIGMAQALGKEGGGPWQEMADDLWQGITSRLTTDGRFVKLRSGHRDINDPDVTEMAPYVVGALRADDAVMRKTADFITQELWDDELGGVKRSYIKYAMPARDNGGHGPYSQYTGWMGQYWVDAGHREQAKAYAEWFLRYNRDGLLPEHVATKERFDSWVERAREAGRFAKAGRWTAAKNVMDSEEYQKQDLVLWVVPLTWGHAEFLLFYHKLEEKGWL